MEEIRVGGLSVKLATKPSNHIGFLSLSLSLSLEVDRGNPLRAAVRVSRKYLAKLFSYVFDRVWNIVWIIAWPESFGERGKKRSSNEERNSREFRIYALYLAPRSSEPFAFALLLGGAVLRLVEFPGRVAFFIRRFLHRFVVVRAAEHLACLHA